MGAWYWVGVSAGLGTAWGVLGSGFTRRVSAGIARSAPIALLGGAAVGGLIGDWRWSDIAVGGIGGLGAYLGAAIIVAGAFRRGGTRLGLAVIMFGMALIAAGIAFIPAAGFFEAISLPMLAWRLRRMQPERYAGLRTLAKD